ncbi:MAG: ribosomal subunit interface protein [Ignavibacteria bacterium GWA2_55_11]|nr:MAG: ribosomal subunit interface protein [Ignavibacteria bacterium GWA2_55_11]OGU43592.1 MAG: ribosomal subunit interface protein [Ignavibacteria bacterium GWC2_56_12]OGU68733.1 MAG: ribosomal subunit interface protein [Ignavibacteria bacterium RIFCSPHIGHO2_02_FULL_56_12]OGU72751.1 MAG: ribosomal subunit interface protein [Ignavibacteria bacterium RIFCSPLOWO2_12_FULL_56_21]HAV22247.1 ribosome-associated translation inhibitor RaiA [Bacteroidota bacterium]
MTTTVTSRHFKAHASLNEYAVNTVEHLGKYYDGIIKAEVILKYEKARKSTKIAEINLSVYNAVLTGEAGTSDFFKSIDSAAMKLRGRLRRYKDKLHMRDRAKVRQIRDKV